MLTATWYCSECCVPSGFDFEPSGDSVVRCCFSNYLDQGHGHSVGLNAETLERAPLWQTCKVLCPWALFHETTVF